MEIKIKAIAHLGHKEGVSKAGREWSVDSFLFDEEKEYPQKFVGDVWDSRLTDWLKANLSTEVSLHFDLNAREYNGKWYNSIKVYRAMLNGFDVTLGGETKNSEEQRVENYFPAQAPPPTQKEDDGLPF